MINLTEAKVSALAKKGSSGYAILIQVYLGNFAGLAHDVAALH